MWCVGFSTCYMSLIHVNQNVDIMVRQGYYTMREHVFLKKILDQSKLHLRSPEPMDNVMLQWTWRENTQEEAYTPWGNMWTWQTQFRQENNETGQHRSEKSIKTNNSRNTKTCLVASMNLNHVYCISPRQKILCLCFNVCCFFVQRLVGRAKICVRQFECNSLGSASRSSHGAHDHDSIPDSTIQRLGTFQMHKNTAKQIVRNTHKIHTKYKAAAGPTSGTQDPKRRRDRRFSGRAWDTYLCILNKFVVCIF